MPARPFRLLLLAKSMRASPVDVGTNTTQDRPASFGYHYGSVSFSRSDIFPQRAIPREMIENDLVTTSSGLFGDLDKIIIDVTAM